MSAIAADRSLAPLAGERGSLCRFGQCVNGFIFLGDSGSGTSPLGREIAARFDLKFLEADDFWVPSANGTGQPSNDFW